MKAAKERYSRTEEEEKKIEFDNQNPEGEEEITGNFMHAYRLTGEAKIAGTIEFVHTLVDNGQKILVFAHHMNVLDAL